MGKDKTKGGKSASDLKNDLDKKNKHKPPVDQPNTGGRTIILEGIFATKQYARSQEEWNFVKELQEGKEHPSELRNIAVGAAVDGKPAPSLTCWHATKKSANFTVFFRWVRRPGKEEAIMRVIGYGNHTSSNKQYEVLWANGVKNTINLKDTSTGAAFLPTP